MPGVILVLSAPSGTGKSTVAEALLARLPELALSVSHTTRAPRGAEADGRDYHFLDLDTFRRMEAAGRFLESATVHGNRYGTARDEVERIRSQGRSVLLDVDVQGGRAVMEALPEALTVFLLPPGMGELERRLRGRGTDAAETIRLRLDNARTELAAGVAYDHLVVNDDVGRAARVIEDLIRRSKATAQETTE
jgi:guanylate kinase